MEFFRRSNGRHVRERQEIFIFKMAPLLSKLLPSLSIDQSRNIIGKCAVRRVAAGIGSERINLNHPATAKPKYPVQASSNSGHLRMCRGLKVRSPVLPCGQQRAVPLQYDSVIDKAKPQEQVSKSLWLFTCLSEHSYLQLRFGVLPSDVTPLFAG